MRCWLEKTLNGCRAADSESADVLKKIPAGTTFECDITTRKTRSGAWHRKYWVLMSMIAGNCEQIEIEPGAVMRVTDADSVHVAMKYLTGLYDSFAIQGGVVRLIKSTAFDRMTPDEWAAYWPRVLDAVHQKILPGIALASVEDEIARLAT